MRKLFIICLITSFTLLISACSIATPYLIVNSSKSPLEVYYELKPSGMMPNESVRKPLFINLKDFESGEGQWQELPSNRFTIDLEKGIVKARIQPNEIVEIESENGIGEEEKRGEHFDIKKLVINGESGSISYEGDHIYKQFKREHIGSWFSAGGTYFVIHYK